MLLLPTFVPAFLANVYACQSYIARRADRVHRALTFCYLEEQKDENCYNF
jgi:hypothetical protein